MAKGLVRNNVSGGTVDGYIIYKDRIDRKMRDVCATRENMNQHRGGRRMSYQRSAISAQQTSCPTESG